MNPQERELLERSLELSEENHKILKKMQKAARWAVVWGFVKVLIIIVPLAVGFFFLQSYFEPIRSAYDTLLNLPR